MRILSFADTRFPIERANGVQTMATCHALAQRGHDVRLIVRPDTTEPARDPFAFYGVSHDDRLRIETIGGAANPRARRARFVAIAAGQASLSRADVVYTRDLGLAALLLQLPLPGRTPVVYESHGVSALVSTELPALLGHPELAPSPGKVARLARREAHVWKHAPAVVTITRALADELTARHGARQRVFVVPDGTALESKALSRGSDPPFGERGLTGSDPPFGERGQTPIAGYAGHLYPWKGVDVLVEALALAAGVSGLIVGGHPREADLARVRERVDRLGLGGRVTMTGLVAPRDVRAWLERATMLVLPNTPSATSERFTSPLKLFEYLAVGRPIVASDVPSIREVLTHGETGWLVPSGDAPALARALEHLARHPDLARRLGEAARALAPEYTWDRRAARLEAAFAAARSA